VMQAGIARAGLRLGRAARQGVPAAPIPTVRSRGVTSARVPARPLPIVFRKASASEKVGPACRILIARRGAGDAAPVTIGSVGIPARVLVTLAAARSPKQSAADARLAELALRVMAFAQTTAARAATAIGTAARTRARGGARAAEHPAVVATRIHNARAKNAASSRGNLVDQTACVRVHGAPVLVTDARAPGIQIALDAAETRRSSVAISRATDAWAAVASVWSRTTDASS